ncbi:NAD-dependent epimerase/dehydratase family protein [bacterium]|nr:NAD-dependent epimerase/dehydratase family protein [bacterium]
MNVLLTGGAGFIGSHIADHLLAAGHDVFVIDNLSSGRRSNVPDGAIFREMDIRSDDVEALWAEHKFDTMVHFAAQINVRSSVEDPKNDCDINLMGILNLLEAGRRHGLKRVVFAGSGGAAFNDDVPFPTPETVPGEPMSQYGVAKITSEHYLRVYHAAYGINYTVMRIGNAYGPRQNPHGEAGVIAIFSKKLLNGETPVIYGTGLQTRDYVFCEDLARMCVIALEKMNDRIYHAGTGRETNVVQLFETIRDAVGCDIEAEFQPAKTGEVMRSCLDSSRAKEELGWSPQVTLEEGLGKTVDFFRRQMSDPDAR